MSTGKIIAGAQFVAGAAMFIGSAGTASPLAYQLMISGALGLAAKEPGTMEGPRLSDLEVQTSTYGAAIPIAYGTIRAAGNVIWSAAIVETVTETSQSAKGDDSVKTNNYSYSQSFAVAICEGEVIGVSKIWANGKLIYNISADSTAASVASSSNLNFTIHIGSETQLADSTIQAVHGADTPAYRGTAYIVFTALQLADYGNRTPNLEFEVVTSGSYSTNPTLAGSVGTNGTPYSVAVSGDYAYVVNYSSSSLQVFNISNKSNPTLTGSAGTAVWPYSIAVSGEYAYVVHYSGSLQVFNISNKSNPTLAGSVVTGGVPYSVAVSGNYAYVANNGSGLLQIFNISDKFNPTLAGSVVTGGGPISVAVSGNYAYMLNYALSSLQVFNVYDKSNPTLAGSVGTSGNPYSVAVSGDYAYVTNYNSNLLQVFNISNKSYPTLAGSVGTGVWPYSIAVSGEYAYVANYNSSSLQVFNISNKSNPTLTGSVGTGGGLVSVAFSGNYAYVANYALSSLQIFDTSTRLTSTPVALSSIVTDVCTGSGLSDGDINITALTDMVDGYVIASRSSARAGIEPLMGAYYFDGIESDGIVKFVKRGTSSGVTIVEDELAAHDYNSEVGDALPSERSQDVELPQEVVVKYMDSAAAYIIGNQYSRRLTGSSINKQSVEMPLAISATKAKQISDVLLFNAWQERQTFQFKTASKYNYLEPTDVVQVVKGGVSHTIRITGKDEQRGICTFDGVAEDVGVYTQTAVAVALPAQNTTVEENALTDLRILDIPLLRDQDDGKGFYSAATGLTGAWSGCVVYKSLDDGASYSQSGNPILSKMTYGLASTVLSDFTQNIFDETNTVTVYMKNGTLASVAELNVLNGENAALLGDEIIQFKTATLTAANTYLLSGLLRGRKGTEWARSTHAVNDRFIFLSTSNIVLQPATNSEFGLARKYTGVSFNTYLDAATKQDFTFNAVAQECYSPVHLGGGRNAANDAIITWTRRTRISGDWTDYADVPLGEATESYEVEIYSSNTYVTLLRIITGVATPTTTYTAAQQTTDGLTPGNPIYFKVYQLSATNGRGYEARGVV